MNPRTTAGTALHTRPSRRARSAAGFTMLELVFVVGVTGVVITIVASMFIGITRDTQRAADRVREIRNATSVLDRIASDIESAYLVRKEPDADPLFHPWIFSADGQRGQDGSDRLMFTTVSHRSDAIAIDPTQRKSAAGLATYAYFLEPDPETLREGSFHLLRWVNPFLAEDHVFPRADDPAAMLVAENVASFAMRFQSEGGEWLDEWDSTLISESGELPIAVEIRLALWPDYTEEQLELLDPLDPTGGEMTAPEYRRTVVLYQRPMMSDSELADFVSGGGDSDDEEDKNCKMTFAQCLELIKPSITPESFDRLNNNNCVETGSELIYDKFGQLIDLRPCGRTN